MKKIFVRITMAVTMAAAMAACARVEEPLSSDGETRQVTLSVNIPQSDLDSKAAGDGTQVNRCILQIYCGEDKYGALVVESVAGGTADFKLQLVTGQDYKFVLWADAGGSNNSDNHYDTTRFPEVAFKGDYTGNDDSWDAFCANVEITGFNGTLEPVTLTRPFGQLNIYTEDIDEIKAGTLEPDKVRVKFNTIPASYDIISGVSSGEREIEYTAKVVETSDEDSDGKYLLSTDYIFAPDDGQLILDDFTMSFLNAAGQSVVPDYTFKNIPVQRNYRTNVSGNLLTKTGTLKVEVNADFLVSTPDELMDVFKTGGSVRLSKDIELTGTRDDVILIGGGSQVQIDLGGKNLTLNGNTLSASDGASLSLTNGTVTGSGLPNNKLLVFAASGGTVLLDGVKMESDGAGVGLNEKCNNGRLEIRNSTINALSFAVGTNATKPVYDTNTIVIDNSTLTAWSAVLFNIPGTLEITGSEITGTNHGVILRGGTATIRNSTLSIAYNEGNASSDSNYNKVWGDGNAVPYAALTVGNRGSGYQYPSDLTLEDCTLQSIEGAAGEENNPGLFPVMYVYANNGDGLGVTIKYDDNTEFTGGIGIVYGTCDNVIVNGKVPDNN